MSKGKIFVVEDEAKIAQLLADYLQQAGYQVEIFLDGREVVEPIQAQAPDFVVLDLMLPGKDGLTICREVRQFSEVPIMMLTAKVDEIDRLLGLQLGADDYVCKPFSPREVVVRVQTILRRVMRTPAVQSLTQLVYQNISLDTDQYECKVDGVRLELTPVEFRMLHTLMKQPGKVYSRDKLMSACYTDGRIVSDRTIDSHVKNLRKKISEALQGEELIHSIYGVGYKID